MYTGSKVALVAFSSSRSNDAFHIRDLVSVRLNGPRITRIRRICSLLSSSECNADLWNAGGNLSDEWMSSLPLPENTLDTFLADRARDAMAGSHPSALEGRCQVNFAAFDGKIKWLHVDPPVITIDNFLSDHDCDELLKLQNVSPPPGAGRVIKMESRVSDSNKERNVGTAVRSSTTWYVRYGAPAVAPLLRALLELLPDVQVEQCEEVQLVRYQGGGQGFGWHEDTLTVNEATPDAGGQRIATLLIYLNECENGRTLFRDLRGEFHQRLAVSPRQGRALLFFPAVTDYTMLCDAAAMIDLPRKTFGDSFFDDTRADHRTSHAGEPPGNNGHKSIAQVWIHSQNHTPRVFGRGLNRHIEALL
jgi:hypothetical protein